MKRLLYFLLIFHASLSMGCGNDPIQNEEEDNQGEEEEVVKPTELAIINGIGYSTLFTGLSAEDYSGITWIGENQYAAVTDKKDGFYLFTLDITEEGQLTSITRSEFKGDPNKSRDCEGIIFHLERGTFFISGEQDQEILEYLSDGSKTGNKLNIPSIFQTGTGNYGFEALAYNKYTGKFWTTTESSLQQDGTQASYINPIHNLLRLQSFNESLEAENQYAYRMDLPEANTTPHTYAFGVPEITALPDGQLLILEREFFVTSIGLGSWVNNKIFLISSDSATDIGHIPDLRTLPEETFVKKRLLWERKTHFGKDLANFEGMCLGPMLNDGSQVLLLINDSQAGYMGVLKEYLLILKLAEIEKS